MMTVFADMVMTCVVNFSCMHIAENDATNSRSWTCASYSSGIDPLSSYLDPEIQASTRSSAAWGNALDAIFNTSDTSMCGANRYVRDDGLRCLAVQQSLCQVEGR